MSGEPLSDEVRTRLAKHVNHVIDGALARERIVGTVVLVSVNGEIVYRRSGGFADREARIPVRENSLFRLASVSKTIASAAAVALVEKGHLGLDEPITNWIPEFLPRLRGGDVAVITARHLLTHTAGLDYGFQPKSAYRVAGVSNGLDMPGLSIEEALRGIAAIPLLHDPGKSWNYSLATDVLGAVMSRATGMPLPSVIEDFVTAPLRMSDTGFVVRDPERLAVPYADCMPRPVRMREPHSVPTPQGVVTLSPARIFDPNSYPSAGAGMVGTAPEFLSLLEVIRLGGNPILSLQGALWLTTGALPDEITFPEPGWTFSLGAAVLSDLSLARTTHDLGTWRWGGVYGNDWFVNPSRKLTVVSFSNTSFEGDSGAYPVDLRDAVYYALTADD